MLAKLYSQKCGWGTNSEPNLPARSIDIEVNSSLPKKQLTMKHSGPCWIVQLVRYFEKPDNDDQTHQEATHALFWGLVILFLELGNRASLVKFSTGFHESTRYNYSVHFLPDISRQKILSIHFYVFLYFLMSSWIITSLFWWCVLCICISRF
jgi:hypothetical protein